MSEDAPTESESDPEPDTTELVPTPDHLLYLRLRDISEVFSNRQSELLRVATFIQDEAERIDDGRRRARESVHRRLGEVDDAALTTVWAVFEARHHEVENPGSLSKESLTAWITELEEVRSQLPPGTATTYLEAVAQAISAPRGTSALLSSLLVTLVGEIELLIAYVIRALFEREPARIDDGNSQFTWSELSRFESMEELREHVVERSVDRVLRGSLDDWMDFFRKRFDLQPPKVASEFVAQELIQRRHITVHNGSLVSAQYLDKLHKFQIEASVGDSLPVDHEYLRRAADTLYLIGMGLITASGLKLCKDPELKSAFLTDLANRTYRLLLDGRLELIVSIVDNLDIQRIESDSSRFVLLVNRWLALKRMGRFQECVGEVEAWDVTTRSNDYKLAKLALMDDYQNAVELSQRMLKSGDLEYEHWLTWPLFEGLRGHVASQELLDPESNPVMFPESADEDQEFPAESMTET